MALYLQYPESFNFFCLTGNTSTSKCGQKSPGLLTGEGEIKPGSIYIHGWWFVERGNLATPPPLPPPSLPLPSFFRWGGLSIAADLSMEPCFTTPRLTFIVTPNPTPVHDLTLPQAPCRRVCSSVIHHKRGTRAFVQNRNRFQQPTQCLKIVIVVISACIITPTI